MYKKRKKSPSENLVGGGLRKAREFLKSVAMISLPVASSSMSVKLSNTF